MAPAPIRVGLVGANVPRNGWAVRAHFPVIAANPAFTLQAVATSRQESADHAARELGAAAAYASADALAADPDVDLVVVGVNVRDHAPIVRAAAAAGKHILCEWPLGIDTAESEALTAEAGGDRLHAMGLQAREAPAVRQARALLDAGFIGRPLSATLVLSDPTLGAAKLPDGYAWTADRRGGVSLLTIPGCHALDATMLLTGALTSVSARVLTQTTDVVVGEERQPIVRTSDDHVAITGVTTSGALLVVHLQGGSPTAPGASLELRGDEGLLRITTGMPTQLQMAPLRLSGARGGDAVAPLPLPGVVIDPIPEAVRDSMAENVAGVYARVAGALHGTGEPPVDFRHAATLHALVDAIEASAADDGRAVSTPPGLAGLPARK